MHDLLLASLLADQVTRDLSSRPGGHPYRGHDAPGPVRHAPRDRVAAWWAARGARTASRTGTLPAT